MRRTSGALLLAAIALLTLASLWMRPSRSAGDAMALRQASEFALARGPASDAGSTNGQPAAPTFPYTRIVQSAEAETRLFPTDRRHQLPKLRRGDVVDVHALYLGWAALTPQGGPSRWVRQSDLCATNCGAIVAVDDAASRERRGLPPAPIAVAATPELRQAPATCACSDYAVCEKPTGAKFCRLSSGVERSL